MTARPDPAWAALAAAVDGDVILPDAANYDQTRTTAIARFDDVRPQAIVRCRTPHDVAETLRFVRRHRLDVVARSGGHCFAGRSTTSGVVIDVSLIGDVSVSGELSTVGAGATLGDVYDRLDRHGLTIPAGTCPPVGIAGLALGGGLGILGRHHGLTSDHLTAAQIVVADGRLLTCDADHHPDLFWALRGAGAGNFGVVTSLSFRTLPTPTVTNVRLDWSYGYAVAVIDGWQHWAPTAATELAASLRIAVPTDIDDPPSVTMFAAVLGTESHARTLCHDLTARVAAEPAATWFQTLPYHQTRRHWEHLGDGDTSADGSARPGHHVIKSEYFARPLPAEAIARLVRHLDHRRRPGQYRELDFTPWGGAYNTPAVDATAFAHRDQLFILKHATDVATRAPAHDKQSAQRWITGSWRIVHPWGSGRVFPNFPDPDLDDWAHAYHGSNYSRLRQVKARYDPDHVFQHHQSIRPP